MNERTAVMTGALIGSLAGACAAYLFFTEQGRMLRDRFEPALDNIQHEFARFQKTIEKFGEMANDGMRVVHEFNAARSQQFPSDRTSH